MIYRFLLNTWIFNNVIYDMLNNVLNQCIDNSSIKLITPCGQHRNTIEFNNDVTYTYWNVNRYYVWLNQGKFEGKINYEYTDARPSAKTMYKFKQLLSNYKIN